MTHMIKAEGANTAKEDTARRCKQELRRVQDGDKVYIATQEAAVKGKVITSLDGAFTLEVESPQAYAGVQMEVRLGGALAGALKAPFDESFFYTLKYPDGRAQPEKQSGQLIEVMIEK